MRRIALLGIATAIRGALLPAGFLLILLCCWQRGWKNIAPLAIAGLASFLAPFILDNLLRQQYHTDNNAVIAFYCVVHDATRFWTSACDEMYRRQGVTADGAIGDYLRFAFSQSGMRFLLSGLVERVRHDLASLSHPAFAVTLILAALASIRSLAAASKPHPALSARTLVRLATEFRPLLISLIAVIASLVDGDGGTKLARCSVLVRLCADQRPASRFRCLGLFRDLSVGSNNDDRNRRRSYIWNQHRSITATYSFALPLGLLAFVIGNEPSAPQLSSRFDMRWGRRVTGGGIAALVFFYFAVWIWPSTWRLTFESDVVGKKAALKVLDNAAVDRSGYYVFVPNARGTRGAGALIYTKRDEFPVGSVRRYERLMNDQAFIGSFWSPTRCCNDPV